MQDEIYGREIMMLVRGSVDKYDRETSQHFVAYLDILGIASRMKHGYEEQKLAMNKLHNLYSHSMDKRANILINIKEKSHQRLTDSFLYLLSVGIGFFDFVVLGFYYFEEGRGTYFKPSTKFKEFVFADLYARTKRQRRSTASKFTS